MNSRKYFCLIVFLGIVGLSTTVLAKQCNLKVTIPVNSADVNVVEEKAVVGEPIKVKVTVPRAKKPVIYQSKSACSNGMHLNFPQDFTRTTSATCNECTTDSGKKGITNCNRTGCFCNSC